MQIIVGTDNELQEVGKDNMAVVEKGRFRKTKKVFWGVLLLLGAVALLVNKMGFLEGFGFWSILFSVVLVGIFVNGLVKRSFGQILFSLAFLVIVNDELLHLEQITPWPVLGAALLGTIGLNILFPRFGKGAHISVNGKTRRKVDSENRDGSRVFYENCFGESVKYLTGEISDVNIESSFGAMQVYFSDAVLREHRANVHVEVSFGSVVLYVPSDWKVLLNMDTAFGSTNEKGQCNPNGENVLYVSGEVSFGELQIRYI